MGPRDEPWDDDLIVIALSEFVLTPSRRLYVNKSRIAAEQD